MEDRRQNNDHDLLITLVQKVDDLKEDIKDIKEGWTEKIREKGVLIEDHEIRMRRLEKWGMIAVGFLYAVETYVNFVK